MSLWNDFESLDAALLESLTPNADDGVGFDLLVERCGCIFVVPVQLVGSLNVEPLAFATDDRLPLAHATAPVASSPQQTESLVGLLRLPRDSKRSRCVFCWRGRESRSTGLSASTCRWPAWSICLSTKRSFQDLIVAHSSACLN